MPVVYTPIRVPIKVKENQEVIKLNVSDGQERIPLGFSVAYNIISGEPYEGPYEVTPTRGTQILYTNEKLMEGNVVVNPIPHDWGHITWDGSVLTVS